MQVDSEVEIGSKDNPSDRNSDRNLRVMISTYQLTLHDSGQKARGSHQYFANSGVAEDES